LELEFHFTKYKAARYYGWPRG